MKGIFVGRGVMKRGQRGWEWVPAHWRGAGSCLQSIAGAWAGREQSREQPGRRNKWLIVGSLILHFIHKVHLCSVCAW